MDDTLNDSVYFIHPTLVAPSEFGSQLISSWRWDRVVSLLYYFSIMLLAIFFFLLVSITPCFSLALICKLLVECFSLILLILIGCVQILFLVLSHGTFQQILICAIFVCICSVLLSTIKTVWKTWKCLNDLILRLVGFAVGVSPHLSSSYNLLIYY